MVWRRKRDQVTQDRGVGLAESALRQDGAAAVEVVGNTVIAREAQSNAAAGSSNSDSVTGEAQRSRVEHGFAQSGSQRPYTVPSGYRISGDIFATRPVVVEGELVGGDCVAQAVFVAPGGTLKGSARVGMLRCAGTIDANVVASQSVEITSQGSVSGRVTAPTMRVDAGARIQGAELSIKNESEPTAQQW